MRLKENTKEKLMLTKIVLIVFLAFVVYALLKKVFFGDARKAGRRTGYERGGSSSSSSYDYSSSSVWSDGEVTQTVAGIAAVPAGVVTENV